MIVRPPSQTKLRLLWNVAILGVAAVGIVSVSVAVRVVQHHSSQSRPSAQKPLVQSTRNVVYKRSAVLVEETRKVYPYSIVPGGAPNLAEAKLAMSKPDVRANYANVDMAKLHEVKLATNLSGYVSYRYGDKIYWTKKKITLRAAR